MDVDLTKAHRRCWIGLDLRCRTSCPYPPRLQRAFRADAVAIQQGCGRLIWMSVEERPSAERGMLLPYAMTEDERRVALVGFVAVIGEDR